MKLKTESLYNFHEKQAHDTILHQPLQNFVFQQGLSSPPMLRRVWADSNASTSPSSEIFSSIKSTALSTEHLLECLRLDKILFFLQQALSMEAAREIRHLSEPCLLLGTGIPWSCFPSYVIVVDVASPTALSTCLRAGHPDDVHL